MSRYQPLNQGLPNDIESQHNEERKSTGTLKRVMMLSIPQWRLLTVGFIALIISSGCMLAIPALFGAVISAVTPPGDYNALIDAILELIGVFVVGSAAAFVRAWTFTWAGQRLVCQLRQDVFAAVVVQDISFFDVTRTGELTSRLASDTAVIQNAATVNISMLIRYSIQIVGAVALLLFYSWELTLIMLSVVPIVIIGAVLYGKFVKKLSKAFQDQLGAAGTTAEEAFSNIRTVRSFTREDASIKQYWDDIYKSYEIGFKLALAQGGFAGVLSLMAQLAIGLVLFVGGKQVLDGDLTPGSLTSFLLYTLTLAMGFAFLSNLFGDFMTAAGASTRIFELMDKKPQIPQTGGSQLENVIGEIRLENVSFKYPSRPEVAVLSDVSLALVPGTVTALVGPSGGGKTTIVSMIERYYDPLSGRVLLDGIDIKEFDPKWYRQQIGFVSQEPVLFGCSIQENISYGVRRRVTQEELIEVAREANALEFIEKMPDKFQTVVGERGVRLSGGQKQRIAIARALLMNPSILLLDEATSALDAESEHLVQEAIDRAMNARTVLIVAHRLSTVRNANCVLVVKDGKIVESGTHDQLMQSSIGIYRKLVKRQLQG